MTGEWEHKLRLMEHGKFPREKFMAEIVEETKGIVERVKGFRGRRFGRARDRYDFTD